MFDLQKETCAKCREDRIKLFPQIVRMEKDEKGKFSPFFEGFSNFDKETVEHIDFMIISESIGNLKHHMNKMKNGITSQQVLKNYYINDKLETFNQQKIRKILEFILWKEKTFYFTDIVKCYVIKKGKGGKENFEKASDYCSENYLKVQIEMLKPKVVILFGRLAEKMFFTKILNIKKRLNHGESLELNKTIVIYSEFPSAMNADRFIKEGGFDKLKESISRFL